MNKSNREMIEKRRRESEASFNEGLAALRELKALEVKKETLLHLVDLPRLTHRELYLMGRQCLDLEQHGEFLQGFCAKLQARDSTKKPSQKLIAMLDYHIRVYRRYIIRELEYQFMLLDISEAKLLYPDLFGEL